MTAIDTRLGRAGRRLMRIGAAAGAAWGLGGATSLLLLGAWLDLLWELSPALRIATLWAAGATGGLLLCTLAAAAVRAARHAAVARRLDRAGGSGGSILTGWELEQGNWGMRQTGPAPSPQWHTSAGLASMAVDQAATIAGRVPLSAAAPLRPLGRARGARCALGGRRPADRESAGPGLDAVEASSGTRSRTSRLSRSPGSTLRRASAK